MKSLREKLSIDEIIRFFKVYEWVIFLGIVVLGTVIITFGTIISLRPKFLIRERVMTSNQVEDFKKYFTNNVNSLRTQLEETNRIMNKQKPFFDKGKKP